MNTDHILLGFSTGVLHKTHTTKEALKIIKDIGCTAVELGFVKMEQIEQGWLDKISPEDISSFRYVSLHAPKFDYGNNAGTEVLFKKMAEVNALRKLDCVVFHPDCVKDFGVFKNAPFRIAFENMDDRKESFQKPEELARVLSEDEKYGMVLDINHIYSNDPSMRLAEEFYTRLGSKIVQIHLSGNAGYHDPIFKTRQTEILNAIQDFTTPIIIESVISAEEITEEKKYVMDGIAALLAERETAFRG